MNLVFPTTDAIVSKMMLTTDIAMLDTKFFSHPRCFSICSDLIFYAGYCVRTFSATEELCLFVFSRITSPIVHLFCYGVIGVLFNYNYILQNWGYMSSVKFIFYSFPSEPNAKASPQMFRAVLV